MRVRRSEKMKMSKSEVVEDNTMRESRSRSQSKARAEQREV
jgi:hypothetical protein